MPRYIDAEFAIRQIEIDALLQFGYSKRDAIDCIKATPSVDAVKVVRCKDCMHSEDESWNNRIWCKVFDRRFNKNGYCSLGERK